MATINWPKKKSTKLPFTDEDILRALHAIDYQGADRKEVIIELMIAYKMDPAAYKCPTQIMGGMKRIIQGKCKRNNPTTIELAKKYGYDIEETIRIMVPEPPEVNDINVLLEEIDRE